jgi:hypothetical protein
MNKKTSFINMNKKLSFADTKTWKGVSFESKTGMDGGEYWVGKLHGIEFVLAAVDNNMFDATCVTLGMEFDSEDTSRSPDHVLDMTLMKAIDSLAEELSMLRSIKRTKVR